LAVLHTISFDCLFSIKVFPLRPECGRGAVVFVLSRHCEARSDEAIQGHTLRHRANDPGLLRSARNDGEGGSVGVEILFNAEGRGGMIRFRCANIALLCVLNGNFW
jgi:hypothetical protein